MYIYYINYNLKYMNVLMNYFYYDYLYNNHNQIYIY